jgi:sugar lactone lactonase YvrE
MATLQSLMVSSPNGGIYLLRPTSPAELYLISSDGRVLRRTRVETPKGTGEPTDMSMMGSSALLVSFSGLRKDSKGNFHVATLLGALDPSTGRLTHTYLLPRGRWLAPACAEGPGKILFLSSSKKNKLEVVNLSTN